MDDRSTDIFGPVEGNSDDSGEEEEEEESEEEQEKDEISSIFEEEEEVEEDKPDLTCDHTLPPLYWDAVKEGVFFSLLSKKRKKHVW